MNPFPQEGPPNKDTPVPVPSLPLNSSAASYSKANRRASTSAIQRIYPWLLFASTSVAATFCLAYITKPVIITANTHASGNSNIQQVASNTKTPPTSEKLTPNKTSFPGEQINLSSLQDTAEVLPAPLSTGYDFEETNIRMQHVLDAASPSGGVDRILVEVPVIYQSRELRWTQEDAATARLLLDSLADHQEKTRNLRDEGKVLLQAWNDLIDASIPAKALRADSPSLSVNQRDIKSSLPAETDSTIKIQRPEE